MNIPEVFNGLLYVLSSGCQWRALPKDLPPRSTVFDYFGLWQNQTATLRRIHAALVCEGSGAEERTSSPTACVIDSQSVKSAEKGGGRIDPPGFDAGKRIKEKKRHV